ncbi:hypothetical protein [Thalassospira povalilytica]|uniref:Uncharacterized protein n=1 Tax=Thalassospira povalilytica TaxID=732237 RepID=A0A8I1MB11_9PROT|nr:hypothetical protein [Thalassospira povalilytica]MBN8198027.1 hypothetical protein [Thalassospira povalilytica]
MAAIAAICACAGAGGLASHAKPEISKRHAIDLIAAFIPGHFPCCAKNSIPQGWGRARQASRNSFTRVPVMNAKDVPGIGPDGSQAQKNALAIIAQRV